MIWVGGMIAYSYAKRNHWFGFCTNCYRFGVTYDDLKTKLTRGDYPGKLSAEEEKEIEDGKKYFQLERCAHCGVARVYIKRTGSRLRKKPRSESSTSEGQQPPARNNSKRQQNKDKERMRDTMGETDSNDPDNKYKLQ